MRKSPTKAQESKSTHPLVFDCPTDIHLSMTFANPYEVRKALYGEIARRQLKGFIGEPYRFRYFPTMRQYHRLYISCRSCQARFKLVKQGKQLVVVKMQPRHSHRKQREDRKRVSGFAPGTLSREQEKGSARRIIPPHEQIPTPPQLLTDPAPPQLLTDPAPPQPPIDPVSPQLPADQPAIIQKGSLPQPKVVKNHKAEEFLGLKTLQALMRDNLVDHRVVWNTDVENRFPSLLVAGSPSMKMYVEAFGDIVHFEVLYDRLHNASYIGESYSLGVFTVEDARRKIHIVAIAIFMIENALTMTEIFRRFLLMQTKEPASISSCDRPAIREALEALSLSGQFSGSHLFNPYLVLANNQSRIVGGTLERVQFIERVKKLAEQRNPDMYKQLMENLLDDSANGKLLEQFIREVPSMFYCGSQSAYVGLGSARSISPLFDREFPMIMTMEDLIFNLEGISRRNEEASKENRVQVKDFDMEELQVADKRLIDVFLHCGKETRQRFVENYLRGIRQFAIDCDAKQYGPSKFRVHSLNKEKSYGIVDWRCECEQQQKTGVGCPHLILAATLTRGKPYLQLISPRWRQVHP